MLGLLSEDDIFWNCDGNIFVFGDLCKEEVPIVSVKAFKLGSTSYVSVWF